jgi:hypothetical protein
MIGLGFSFIFSAGVCDAFSLSLWGIKSTHGLSVVQSVGAGVDILKGVNTLSC